MILKCTCSHGYQDRIHGIGNRVFNACKDGSFRCTICEAKQSKRVDTTIKNKK